MRCFFCCFKFNNDFELLLCFDRTKQAQKRISVSILNIYIFFITYAIFYRVCAYRYIVFALEKTTFF